MSGQKSEATQTHQSHQLFQIITEGTGVNAKSSQQERFDLLREEEMSLFSQLIIKTSKKLKESVSRIKLLIHTLKLLELKILVKLLKKTILCMNKMLTFLNQMSDIIQQKTHNKHDYEFLRQTTEGNMLDLSSEEELSPIKVPSRSTKKQDINIGMLADVFGVEHDVLKDFESLEFKIYYNINNHKIQGKVKEMAKRIIKLSSKLATINLIFPLAAFFPQDDLFSCSFQDKRWIYLQIHYIKKKVLGVSTDVRAKFNKYVSYMAMFMYFTFQFMSKAEIVNFKGKQEVFNESWIQLLDYIFKQGTDEELKTIYSLDTGLFPKVLWNITTYSPFKTMVSPAMPSISYSFSLFIPKNRRQQIIDSIYDSSKPLVFTPYKQANNFDLKRYKTVEPYNTHAEVHINSNFQLVDYQVGHKKQAIIIHIHGGGFISMSSYLHQFYIRKWAKKLNVPIFSVQYGKAPEYPFPNALADCIEVYIWILEHSKQLFKTINLKIILMGDSSGGNLVCGLTNFLIMNNLPLPDKLLLFYPSLRVQVFYTPSFLHGLDDMILSHSVLLKIRQAYVGDFPQKKSPLISPLYSSRDMLSKYPSVVCLTGSQDPLRDDCFRMIEKLNEAKKGNAWMTIFEDFPHGFLHFDTDIMPNQYVREAYNYIQELLVDILKELSGSS